MANVKKFLKTKYKGFLFDGVQMEGYFNIHSLNKETYDFIPKLDEQGEFGYVRLSINLIMVKNQSIKEFDIQKMDIVHQDLLCINTIPLFLPLLNYNLNVFNNEKTKEQFLELFQNRNKDEISRLNYRQEINRIKEKLIEFSFVYIEGKIVKLLEFHQFNGFVNLSVTLSENDIDKIDKSVKDKMNTISEKLDLIKFIFNSLTEDYAIHYLINFNYKDCKNFHDIKDFLKIDLHSQEFAKKNHSHLMNDQNIQKMIEDRFISCIRKQFDLSWVVQKVNNEMSKLKRKDYYQNNKKKIENEFTRKMNEMLKQQHDNKNLEQENIENEPNSVKEQLKSWNFVNENQGVKND